MKEQETIRRNNLLGNKSMFEWSLSNYCHKIHPTPIWYREWDYSPKSIKNPRLTIAEWCGYYKYIDKLVKDGPEKK